MSVAAAEKGCNDYEECEAYFCSTKFSAPPALKVVAKGKGPLMCFGRAGQVTAASAGDTAYVKAYTNTQPWEYLAGSATESLHGASLVNLTVTHDGKTATITMTGPAGNWYGVGFNAQNMADAPCKYTSNHSWTNQAPEYLGYTLTHRLRLQTLNRVLAQL